MKHAKPWATCTIPGVSHAARVVSYLSCIGKTPTLMCKSLSCTDVTIVSISEKILPDSIAGRQHHHELLATFSFFLAESVKSSILS